MEEQRLPNEDTYGNVIRLDRATIDGIYKNQKTRLYASALKMLKNEEQAKDAVHDVFLKICDRGIKDYSPEKPIEGYLYVLLRTTILDMFKRNKTHQNYQKSYLKYKSDADHSTVDDLAAK